MESFDTDEFTLSFNTNEFLHNQMFPFVPCFNKHEILSLVSMQEGDFEMKHIDKVGSQSFNVAIAPFSLSILGDNSDSF